jgi:hypothetical protein
VGVEIGQLSFVFLILLMERYSPNLKFVGLAGRSTFRATRLARSALSGRFNELLRCSEPRRENYALLG